MKSPRIPSRVRSLQNLRNWSASFSGRFPSGRELAENPTYWNWKIPVYSTLIEGSRASPQTQRECAQLLIDACSKLLRSKPVNRSDIRVTCCVCLPDMFTSELCIYLRESYFLDHVASPDSEPGGVTALNERSLANEWNLNLPEGVLERGVFINAPATEAHENVTYERWFYGEVAT